MSTLNTIRNYADGDDFTETEINDFLDSIEAWANGNISDTNILNNGIGTLSLASSAVTATKLAADAVTSAKIQDGAVTGTKLATSCADDSTLEVSGGSMRIKDNGVTRAKVGSNSIGQQVSSSCGDYGFGNSSSSYATPTNLTVTITTLGRPVRLELVPDGTGDKNSSTTVSFVGATGSGNTAFCWRFIRDGSSITGDNLSWQAGTSGAIGNYMPPSAFAYTDVVSAGTYVYAFQTLKNGSTSSGANRVKLIAYEIA